MADTDLSLDVWRPSPTGLDRLVVVPEQIQVAHRPDGVVVVLRIRNGVEDGRMLLGAAEARHLARLLLGQAA